MIGYIYLTINDINNTCYIGKRQKPAYDKAYRGSGTHLKLALKKYGTDHFSTVILQWCKTVDALNKAEKEWISKFRSWGVDLYNIAQGGDGGNCLDWSAMPAERREAINRKNSDSHMGKKNPFFGRHHTEETKRVLREKNSKLKRPEALRRYKDLQRAMLPPIVQRDKKSGEIVRYWANWCEAGEVIHPKQRCAYTHISECCQGKRKSAYGYIWMLAEVKDV